MNKGSQSNSDAIIRDIFTSWDTNKSGFIEKAELYKCCEDLQLSTSELEQVFIELDVDKDGKISLNDFGESFHKVCSLFHVSRDAVLNQDVTEYQKFEKLLEAIGFQGLLSG